MALATTAAAVAGSTALASYLDAKFHIRKDLHSIGRLRRGLRLYKKAVEEDKVSIWYLFSEVVARHPDAVCLWSRMGIYTWGETHAMAKRYAQYMISRGVRPGQLVAMYLMNSPEFIFIWIALCSLGCAPAFINYNLTGDALVHCLRVCDAKVLLADEEEGCRRRLEQTRERIDSEFGMDITILDVDTRREIEALKPREPEKWYRDGMKGNFPLALIYTSGTTGMPKGCAYTLQRNWCLDPINPEIEQKQGPGGDRWYDCMPMYHGTGGVSAMRCMTYGVSVAIGRKFSVSGFWKDIHDSEATIFIYVGETARYLLAAPPSPYDRDHKLRMMFGNGMRPDVWKRFQERFNVPEVGEFFNSSEGIFSLLNYCKGDYLACCVGIHGLIQRWQKHNEWIPVAFDYETGDIWRDPKTGFAKRMPYSVGGEMICKIPHESAFQGYWNSPSATNKKYVRDVFETGDLYYRTGDALRRDDDGKWFFLDRLGDTFRWKSENVSTAEVGEVLGRYPGVVEANVYGVLVPSHEGRAGCAAVLIERDQQGKFDYNGLLMHARSYLPRYAVPVFIRVIDSSVIIHNNKQNKVPLREEGIDPDLLGTRSTGGERDTVLWVTPNGEGYAAFGRGEWEMLKKGIIKL